MCNVTMGPWEALQRIPYYEIKTAYKNGGYYEDVEVQPYSEVLATVRHETDARLMASAPEMFDLLRQAADELHAIGCGKDPADGLELSEHIAAFLMDLDREENAE